jgi:hypothetical protein
LSGERRLQGHEEQREKQAFHNCVVISCTPRTALSLHGSLIHISRGA